MTDKVISLNVSIVHGQNQQVTVNITSTAADSNPSEKTTTTTTTTTTEKSKEINELRIKDCLPHLRRSHWFYGHMSHSEAVDKLDNSNVGTFLVRYSSNPDPKYSFSVSLKTKANGVKSMRVTLKDDLFYFRSSAVFANVVELIQFHVAGSDTRTFSDQLTYPRYHSLPSLAHLCRLRINRINCENSADVLQKLPQKIRDYIDLYPFFV